MPARYRSDDQRPTTIRRATIADGAAVREFVFATLRSYGIEPDAEGLDADVMSFGTHGDGPIDEFVAEVDGRAVGSVAIAPIDAETGHLSKFFVDHEHRGRGLGRLLLAQAVDQARRRGYQRITLETRTAFEEAVHLYEATGWQRGADLPAGYGPDRTYALDLTAGR
jgi:GNAT superfamily N-acetyltransferase